MAVTPDPSKGQPGIAEAALFGLCPRCGGRTLFAGWTRFAHRCRGCGLDLAAFNVGDGPAAFRAWRERRRNVQQVGPTKGENVLVEG